MKQNCQSSSPYNGDEDPIRLSAFENQREKPKYCFSRRMNRAKVYINLHTDARN